MTIFLNDLPSKESVMENMKKMNSFGSRLTGTKGQNAYTAWLKDEITKMGYDVIDKQYTFKKWEATDWSLTVEPQNQPGKTLLFRHWEKCRYSVQFFQQLPEHIRRPASRFPAQTALPDIPGYTHTATSGVALHFFFLFQAQPQLEPCVVFLHIPPVDS